MDGLLSETSILCALWSSGSECTSRFGVYKTSAVPVDRLFEFGVMFKWLPGSLIQGHSHCVKPNMMIPAVRYSEDVRGGTRKPALADLEICQHACHGNAALRHRSRLTQECVLNRTICQECNIWVDGDIFARSEER